MSGMIWRAKDGNTPPALDADQDWWARLMPAEFECVGCGGVFSGTPSAYAMDGQGRSVYLCDKCTVLLQKEKGR